MNPNFHHTTSERSIKVQPSNLRITAIIAASVTLGLFGAISMSVIRTTFGGPDIPEPENYTTACDYVLTDRLGYGEAGVEWIKKNTDHPVNAYIGLMGVRAKKSDSFTWSDKPEYQALLALGTDAIPAINQKLKELSDLENRRRMDSARMAGLINNPGYNLPGQQFLWLWKNGLTEVSKAINSH